MWNDINFWDDKWKEDHKKSLYGYRRKDMDYVEWWNQRAGGFASQTKEKQNHRGQERIFECIYQSGFVNSHEELLDIGCGPGNFALPLAGKFKHVVAVDSSPEMLSILKERAEAMNIHNVETVCLPWEEVDLDKFDWRKRFGLVLAIKTPGINNLKTLQKMIDSSCHGCFYNGFIKREDPAQKELWRLLFDDEKPPVPADAFYVFHLVNALGYTPIFKANKSKRERRVSAYEAEQELVLMMKPYKDVSGKMPQYIHQYVQKNAVDGEFLRVRNSVEGTMLWSVCEE